jgi:hypothetical protein
MLSSDVLDKSVLRNLCPPNSTLCNQNLLNVKTYASFTYRIHPAYMEWHILKNASSDMLKAHFNYFRFQNVPIERLPQVH